MQSIWHDIRFGARVLRKNPAFSTVCLITLALGIGASTGIFSVVNTVLLSPLPYPDAGRIVLLSVFRSGKLGQISPANFLDFREQSQSFQEMAAIFASGVNLASKTEPERVQLAITSSSFFDVLGVRPGLGRGFMPEDEAQGHRPVVIISHRLWQQFFKVSDKAIGEPGAEQSVTIDGKPYSVIGVMPGSFDYPKGTDVWLPPSRIVPEINMDIGDVTKARDLGYLAVIARLKEGVALKQAQAEMAAIGSRLAQQYPDANTGLTVGVAPLQESITGTIRPALLLLIGAVGLLLLIACANVANLMLGRASARRQEMAVRVALGASPPRIVRQLLTESLMLAVAGGGLGLMLAKWGIRALVVLGAAGIPRAAEIHLDGKVLAFALVISCAVGILFGLAPVRQSYREEPALSLQSGPRAGIAGSGFRNCLVISEIALSLTLLVGAGLLFRSFLKLQQVRPGFNIDRLLTFRISPAGAGYDDDDRLVAFYGQLLDRFNAIPGVQAAGAVNTLPLDKGPFYGYFVEANPPFTPQNQRGANFRVVSADYFKSMGIRLVSGRGFTTADTMNAPGALIINRALARRDFPGGDPVGQRLGFGYRNGQVNWKQIVGVVDDFKNDGLKSDALPEAYQPYAQNPFPAMSFVLRATGDTGSLIGAVRAEAYALDQNQPISSVETMDRLISESVSEPRFNMILFACFAGIALVMAASGIYAVMSYAVDARTHEIGVRVALGAGRAAVLRLILGKALALALAGIGIGVAGTYGLTRLMSTLLFGVTPTDPATFTVIAIALGVVALVASYVPARRALGVDPMIALRHE
jgi:putative ABC transport system permease protein